MLKQADKVLCYLITGLGVVFLALTPMYAGSFVSRGGVEFMGAVLFLVFRGCLTWRGSSHSTRRLDYWPCLRTRPR